MSTKKPDNSSAVGERIQFARKAAKLSQTELARQIGKTLRTVQKYEVNEIAPSIATIDKIAAVVKVPPTELLGYSRKASGLGSPSKESDNPSATSKRNDLLALYNGIVAIQKEIQDSLLEDAALELQYEPEIRSSPDYHKVSVMAATQVLQDYIAARLNLTYYDQEKED